MTQVAVTQDVGLGQEPWDAQATLTGESRSPDSKLLQAKTMSFASFRNRMQVDDRPLSAVARA